MINATTLRTLRTDRGYSIRSLAKAGGVDHQTIRRLENGADPGDLPLRVLYRVATALGVEPPALMTAATDARVAPELQQRIGGTILSAPGTTITAVATALQLTVDEVQASLPALTQALQAAGLSLARHGEALRINPRIVHPAPDTNTRPMTVNEARLLRSIHRGEDVRRSLSKTDRELTLPALIRAGLVNPATPIPTTFAETCHSPADTSVAPRTKTHERGHTG